MLFAHGLQHAQMRCQSASLVLKVRAVRWAAQCCTVVEIVALLIFNLRTSNAREQAVSLLELTVGCNPPTPSVQLLAAPNSKPPKQIKKASNTFGGPEESTCMGLVMQEGSDTVLPSKGHSFYALDLKLQERKLNCWAASVLTLAFWINRCPPNPDPQAYANRFSTYDPLNPKSPEP